MSISSEKSILKKSGPPLEPFFDTLTLEAYTISKTEARFYYAGNDADTYEYEVATDAGFITVVKSATGVTSSPIDVTGLTIGTDYFARIKAVKSGFRDGPYSATATFTTITFDPEVWIEIAGLRHGIDNIYGNSDGGAVGATVVTLKSVIGTNAITLSGLSPATSSARTDNKSGVVKVAQSPFTTKYIVGSSGMFTLDNPFTLTGDFTICFRQELEDAYRCWQEGSSSDGSYIAFNGLGQPRVYITTTKYQYDLSGGDLIEGKIYDHVFKRVGTNLHYSFDGGSNFELMTASAKTDAFTVEFFGGGALTGNYFGNCMKWLCVDEELSESQLSEFFNYGVGSAVTTANLTEAIEIEGATFAAPPADNIIIDGEYSLQSGQIRRTWAVLAVGSNMTFFTWHYNGVSEDYATVIYGYNHTTGELSEEIKMPIGDDDDNHLYGGVVEFDGRLMNIQPNVWYDSSSDSLNYPILRAFAKGDDKIHLDSYQELPTLAGVDNGFNDNQGYFGFHELSQRRFIISQGFLVGTGSGARFINVAYSDDYCNYWKSNRILDTGDATRWAYPIHLYNDRSRSEIVFGVNMYDTVTSEFSHSFLIRVDEDGKTVKNWEDDFSQDLSDDNYLSWTDLTTNFQLDTSGTVSVRIQSGVFDGSNVLRLFAGNNAADGDYDYYIGSVGSALTKKSIDFGVDAIVSAIDTEGGYLTIEGDLYVLRENGGNWEVVKYTTADDGDNWGSATVISVTNGQKHDYIYGTANQLNGNRVLTYCRVESGSGASTGVGSLVFKDIT